MEKHAGLIIVTLLLVLSSGCFPVFVPVDDGHHRGDRGHDHGGGHDHNGGHDDDDGRH